MNQYDEALVNQITSNKTKISGVIDKINNANVRRVIICLMPFIIGRLAVLGINPLIIAFFLVVYVDKTSRFWIFVTTVIGLVISLDALNFIKYFLIMVLFVSIVFIVDKRYKKCTLFKIALIGCLSTFLISLLFIPMSTNKLYLFTLAVTESIVVFTISIIYSKGILNFINNKKIENISNDVVISLSFIGATIIAGAYNLNFFQESLKETSILLLILYFGYVYGIGVGSVIGILTGLILFSMGIFTSEMIAVLAVIGLLSGLFKELGKVGSSIGFVIGFILLGKYMEPDMLDFQSIKSLVSSVIIFFLLPIVNNKISLFGNGNYVIDNSYYKDKIQILTQEKLKRFASSFHRLSKVYNSIAEKKSGLSQQEVNQLFEEVANQVCKNCSMNTLCWQKDFYDTYKASFSIIGATEKKGRANSNDIPKEFSDRCIKLQEFVGTINRLYEMFKINMSWHNKIAESRELVALQMNGVANIIEHFSEQIYAELELEKKYEKEIKKELEKVNLEIKNIIVVEKQNRKEVEMTVRARKNNTFITKDLSTIISRILNHKMKLDDNCKYMINNTYSEIKFVEEKLFRTIQGVSRITKEGERVCGDNFSFLQLSNGETILALSDGMGTGIKACKESEAAIDLLEQFIETGFNKQIALQLINSVLVLKSNEQSFSTLDICTIDMYTGLCEFIKVGAAPTFIKRKDCIEIIKSTSLPVGLLNKVDFEVTHRKLYEGDLIIMVTDGVVDSNDEIIEKEKWIENLLLEIKSKNPQEIADYIVQVAKENSKQINDDMTVLVCRIWKK